MYKKLKDRIGNKKGFTLVELIVVIVIILILAAVLVPSLTKYIESANKANVKSNAASILTQVQADNAAIQSGNKDVFGVGSSGITVGKLNVSKLGSTATLEQTTEGASYKLNDSGDVVEFIYNNGTYTIEWKNGTWGNPEKN